MKMVSGTIGRKWGGVLAVFAIITLGTIYFLFNPLDSVYFPKCPFHLFTGYDCPGCGSQRTIHHLLHLDIVNAFKANALFVLAIPYIVAGIYFEYLGGKKRYPNTRKIFFGSRASILIFIIVIVFWIGRNII